MEEQKDIPVCTLFKVSDDPTSNIDIFSNSSVTKDLSVVSKQESEVLVSLLDNLSNLSKTDESFVCDSFQSVSGDQDLDLTSISQLPSNIIETKDPNVDLNEIDNVESTVETADRALKNDFPLQQSQGILAVAGDTKFNMEKEERFSDIGSYDQIQSKPENTEPANNSDSMTSIMINDSFDNISGYSMNENSDGKTDTFASSTTSANTLHTAVSNMDVFSNVAAPDNLNSQQLTLDQNKNEVDVSERTSCENYTTHLSSVVSSNVDVTSSISEEVDPVDNNLTVLNEEDTLECALHENETSFSTVVDSENFSDATPFEENSKTKPTFDIEANSEVETVENEISEQTSDVSQPPVASALFSSDDNTNPFDNICLDNSAPVDDAFSNALQSSETERRNNAWIPNEHTRTILHSVALSQKRIKIEAKYSTRPGLSTSESLGDPVKAVMVRFKDIANISQRKTLSCKDVPKNEDGIKKLVETGNYRSAVDLCGIILTDLGQGFGNATQESQNSPETLRWWHARLALLLQLKLYDMASTEISQFDYFDNADLYYEFYPDLYPGRKGSMVPFSLRLLHADFPRHSNKPNEALTRLYALQSTCKQIILNLKINKSEDGNSVLLKADDKEASLELWNERRIQVLFCISNVLMQQREYDSAISVLDEIISQAPSFSVYLHSSIGRALLQLGDVKAAQQRFAQAERIAGTDEAFKVQLFMNRAFLYLGANNWKEALKQFDEVLQVDSSNIDALNNKAVCLLYLCRLKDAIAVQEQAVKMSDNQHLSVKEETSFEGALSNLVTLYELESSKSFSKKQSLLQQVAIKSGDGFNVACLKM